MVSDDAVIEFPKNDPSGDRIEEAWLFTPAGPGAPGLCPEVVGAEVRLLDENGNEVTYSGYGPVTIKRSPRGWEDTGRYARDASAVLFNILTSCPGDPDTLNSTNVCLYEGEPESPSARRIASVEVPRSHGEWRSEGEWPDTYTFNRKRLEFDFAPHEHPTHGALFAGLEGPMLFWWKLARPGARTLEPGEITVRLSIA